MRDGWKGGWRGVVLRFLKETRNTGRGVDGADGECGEGREEGERDDERDHVHDGLGRM